MSHSKLKRISSERLRKAFDKAFSFEQFAQKTEFNSKRFLANFAKSQLNAQDRQFFDTLPEVVHVVALVHDWCGDVVASLPLFGKIEAETGKIKLHILLRDDHIDIANQYLHADGRSHVPTYIFFNQNGEELGVILERPEEITQLVKKWIQAFWHAHPELEGRPMRTHELDEPLREIAMTQLNDQRDDVFHLEKELMIASIRAIVSLNEQKEAKG